LKFKFIHIIKTAQCHT